MQITFVKESLTHHTLEVVRNTGSTEKVLLETKSFMPHDLIHFLYEQEAGLQNSFWGQIAQGKTFAELNDKAFLQTLVTGDSEIADTERIVGPLQGYFQADTTADYTVSQLYDLFSASNRILPSQITSVFLETLREKFRKLKGHWDAIKRSEPLLLTWKE
jgi:hypothetical protein